MILMLDTDYCIDMIRNKTFRDRSLPWIRAHEAGDLGISVITLAELEYGVEKSSSQERNKKALDKFLLPLEVAEFDNDAAACYGKIRAGLEKRGKPIGSLDMLIGATAVSLDIPLVTNNVSEFRRIPGLKIQKTGV